jgi:peptidoglycan/xylan/chitin deacetylase (PgdA/CDA1 family)
MYMGLSEVAAVHRAGMTIAAHTRTHPDLTKLGDAQLRDEVLGSRQDLQKMLGVNADLFAYPYGAWNKRVAAAVQDAGYRAARRFPGGPWNDAADRFALHSVIATDDMAAFEREVGAPVVATQRPTSRVAVARRR